MRFNLSDDTKGPQATVLVEGFQNSWLSATGSGFSGDASQFEGFEIQNYAGLNNGDAMVMYNRYVYNTGGASMSMNALSKLNNFYYRFEADSTYKRLEVDVDKAGTLVQQEISGNTGNTATFAPGNIYQIPCYFRSSANKDKFYFAIPYYYWDGTRSYNKSLIVSAVRPSATAAKLDVNRYTSTAMCGNSWNQTASYQVINGVYYSLDTNWVYGGNGGGTQVTALTKKDMGFATETPVADEVYTISNNTTWGGSKQIFVSKDYLYVKAPNAGGWTGTSTPGDSLERYDPAQFDKTRSVGQQLGTALSILQNADNISVQSIASTSSDNVLKVVGRKTDDPDLVKVYGTIDLTGLLSWAAQKSTTYSPVTIVKL
jgi:hypothetical protein